MDRFLRMLFFQVFGNTRSANTDGEQIYQMIIQFLKDQHLCIYTTAPQRKQILAQLAKTNRDNGQLVYGSYVKFMCEYGCALLISKPTQSSPININIISPSQWESSTNSGKGHQFSLCLPKNYTSIHTSQYHEYKQKLSDFVSRFENKLISILANLSEQQSAGLDQSQIMLKCLTIVRNDPEFKQYYRQQLQIKDNEPPHQGIKPSNHQTYNMAWYVVQAVVRYLVKDSNGPEQSKAKSQKLLIGFKASILQKDITEKQNDDQITRKRIKEYKKCLNQLIYSYRSEVSSYTQKNDKFFQIVNNLESLITKVKGGKLTSKINTQNQQSQAAQIQFDSCPPVYLEKPKHQSYQKVKQQIKIIKQYTYEVDRRVPFRHLLKIYQKQTINQDWVKKTECEKQEFLNHWILLVEKTIFEIAYNIEKKDTDQGGNIIDLCIHMREIQCEIGASNICKLVLKYQQIVDNNKKHYGSGLKGQTVSHLHLIKSICSVIAFESVKMNRQQKNSNLNDFRIPNEIDKIYHHFISHDYLARRAMKSMLKYHNKRKNKLPLFDLDGTCNSFIKFGKLVGQDTRSAHVWLQNATSINQLQRFEIAHSILVEQNQNEPIKVNMPFAQFSEESKYFYAFLHSVPPDVLGLMKIIMLSQNPIKPTNEIANQLEELLRNKNQFGRINSIDKLRNEELPIRIFNNIPDELAAKILNPNTDAIYQSIQCIQPEDNIKIYYDKCEIKKPILQLDFQLYSTKDAKWVTFDDPTIKRKYDRLLRSFILPPKDQNCKREHQAYASQNFKHKDMEIQQFLALATTRSASETQIIGLCSNILQRKIIPNCYDKGHSFQEGLFLLTAGQLSSYKSQTERHFKSLKKLLSRFISIWTYSDTTFCPIFGPFVGYIFRQLQDEKIIHQSDAQYQNYKNLSFRLAEKCWEQFQRGQKQLELKPDTQIQWNQRFLITAALCCFRERKLTISDKQEILFLTKLIFQFGIAKLFSEKEKLSKKKRSFHTERNFSLEKVLFSNIEIISQFINQHQQELNRILIIFDQGIPLKLKWQRMELYQFVGSSDLDEYRIDLYRGLIMKNGRELSVLDKQIVNNKKYKDIFQNYKYFRVYPSKQPGFQRTKDNLAKKFKVDSSKYEIFFQFSKDGQRIRYIIRNIARGNGSMSQEIWELIQWKNQLKSEVHLPLYYQSKYSCWYCEQNKCIVFRKTKYYQIYQIGLVLHLRNFLTSKYQIDVCYQVIYNKGYDHQDLQQICHRNNNRFDALIIRPKTQQIDKLHAYKYLVKFESPEYIFQLRNHQTNQIYYQLNRYHLKFSLRNKQLVSENHYGYAIDTSYFENEQSIFKKFDCLVLKKDKDNLMMLNNHRHIILISDGLVQQEGKILKRREDEVKINFFKYTIHDFFGELRGSDRESQFHLAALMLSINDNMKFSPIQMTPEEYAISVLKGCFTNRPFNKRQQQKFLNIINLSDDEVLIMCQIIWKGSIALKDILPFSRPRKPQTLLLKKMKQQEKALSQSRSLYQKRMNCQSISSKKQIESMMLNFIGVTVQQTNYVENRQRDSEFSSFSKWRGIKQFNGEHIIQEYEKIKKLHSNILHHMNKLQYFTSCLTKQNDTLQQQEIKGQLPEKILSQCLNNESSEMMKLLVKDLVSSSASFKINQLRCLRIKEQYSGQEKKQKKIALVHEIIRIVRQCQSVIEQLTNDIRQQNESHPDVISGFRSTLSQASYTRILCFKDQIYTYFPNIDQQVQLKFKQIIKIWMDIKTRIASLERILILLDTQNIDIIALLRQIGSPRKEIFQRTSWICYEAEMKIQIWHSQLQIYENLMKNTNKNPYCQLNMGQGKTQVIIPLIILDQVFNQSKILPRVNLLASLFGEARQNLFKFLAVTGFKIFGLQIPFTRKVELTESNIKTVQYVLNSFLGASFAIVTRESRLSQVLKYDEIQLGNSLINFKHKNSFLERNKIFDIFDQIDLIMTSKKSTVFSLGNQISLPSSDVRFQIQRSSLQAFLKCFEQLLSSGEVTCDEFQQDAINAIKSGEYPCGLRITPQFKYREWYQKIVYSIIKDPLRHEYSFIKSFTDDELKNLVDYCTDPMFTSQKLNPKIPKDSKDQIYILRGIFAYGILKYCLSKRCGIDYGIAGPNHANKKRIAVPYEAADIPSPTSQFEHPQISAILTYIAYYMKGLQKQQFQSALNSLEKLSPTAMESQYKQWFQILAKNVQEDLIIKKANQINFKSAADRTKLFEIYKKNRRAISFWLIRCIFPIDLQQYKESICSSAFDLAEVEQSIGFSGTTDSHWVIPYKNTWTPCQSHSIKGTDGRMLHLSINHIKQVCLIPQSSEPLWQRLINQALLKKVGCVIDCGAICVGKSLKGQIVPWIAQHKQFNIQKYQGVSFCDVNGSWQVYDIQSKNYKSRGTTIPDEKTFVIYDEARSRGADLKMHQDTVAALSLGSFTTKDKFMQAAGRLRKLGRNQSIIIFASHEVLSTIPTFPKTVQSIKEKICTTIDFKQIVSLIIAWCCKNTIKQNQSLLLQYSHLGWRHIYSKVKNEPYKHIQALNLQQKYEGALETKYIHDIINPVEAKLKQHKQSGKNITELLAKYGRSTKLPTQIIDMACQRQPGTQKLPNKIQLDYVQNPYYEIKPIHETDEYLTRSDLNQSSYNFNSSFRVTTNFIDTTTSDDDKKKDEDYNELPQCYFVKHNQKQFVLVSLRQASNFIKEHILSQKMAENNYQLSLLSDLQVNADNQISEQCKQSIVSAKLIAGYQNYNNQEQKYLIRLLMKSVKESKIVRQNKENKQIRQQVYINLVSQILKKRRTFNKKFKGSDLEKIIINLHNEQLEIDRQIEQSQKKLMKEQQQKKIETGSMISTQANTYAHFESFISTEVNQNFGVQQ